ncbi:substrate-binding domain-containing protein [Saccharothrix sp. MB29]|nr:substrate-binding domain-containing protein [Saccharothrix sp. MB29]
MERLTGLRQAFAEAGVEPAAHRCPKWMPEDGYDTTRAILRSHRPEALVCFNDRLAFGAYQALGEAGLFVPDDVSVIGFDDHPIASRMRPRLTTVARRTTNWARAVDVLLDLFERRRRTEGAGRPPDADAAARGRSVRVRSS